MKKTCLLASICSLICVNYYILRNLKDALIITETGAGAEVIPFLKTWALIPSTVFLVIIFTSLCNRLNFRSLFVTVISFFLVFFALFTFVIYPLGSSLYLETLAGQLNQLLPEGWSGFVAMIRFWPLSLFYVIAESWASIVWYVLFWGFANEVIRFDEAKKHYPAIILAGNLSAIVAGTLVNLLTFPSWTLTLNSLTILIISCGLGTLFLFFLISKENSINFHLGSNEKMGFFESFNFVKKSPYFICLALLVIGFNLTINLSEVIWKDQVLSFYPHPGDYNAYMNRISIVIGIFSTLITLFIIRYQSAEWGWTPIALITPLVTFGSALIFFFPLIFFSTSFLFLGSLHIILSRSSRYTLLDMSKEMAFIPFSSDEKLKAKTHIDGIGSRFGKSLGSGIFQGLLLFSPSISACTPFIFILLTIFVFSSVFSINTIGQEIKSST